MFVVYSPTGTGKTTYVHTYLNQWLKANPNKQRYALWLTSSYSLKSHLHIPDNSVSRWTPDGSIVVIDAAEAMEWDEKARASLLSLAIESRNTKKYNVIVVVSDREKADTILRLNGNDKVAPLCAPATFQWGAEEVDKFIEDSFKCLTTSDREFLKKEAKGAACPGFLQEMMTHYNDKKTLTSGDHAFIKQRALMRIEEWKSFQELDKKYPSRPVRLDVT
eukprot:gb/GECG01011938.1/.p1 GENE.gb/GECG01011938.1/~~gb/GECG01011938.1/.p1  ORF type:complete len:220 (+),score=27.86 gb/GECG01011938.1/:1-660(+)